MKLSVKPEKYRSPKTIRLAKVIAVLRIERDSRMRLFPQSELTRDPDVNNTWQFNPGNAGDIVVVRVIPVVQREVWSNAGPGNR
jgi:hypothetical protein